MTYRVWWKPEFDDCKTDEDRDEIAWHVPDEVGILDPSVRYPCNSAEDAAEKYADYFHNERDGYENTWPIEFVVNDGTRFFVVEVDREMVPEFRAGAPTLIVPHQARLL